MPSRRSRSYTISGGSHFKELWRHWTAFFCLLWLIWNPAQTMMNKLEVWKRAWKSSSLLPAYAWWWISILTFMSMALLKKKHVDLSSVQAMVVSTISQISALIIKARMANSCMRFCHPRKMLQKSIGKRTQLKLTQMQSSSSNQFRKEKFLDNWSRQLISKRVSL